MGDMPLGSFDTNYGTLVNHVILPMDLCYSNNCTLTRNILQQEAVVLHVLPGVLYHLQQLLSVSNTVDESMFHYLQYIRLLLHKNSNLKTFCVEVCG